MKRSVERATRDSRWRTEIHLTTGAVLIEHSEWKPSHWDAHDHARLQELKHAHELARNVTATYGVHLVRILQFQETRRTLSVTEHYESESLHSEHLLTGREA